MRATVGNVVPALGTVGIAEGVGVSTVDPVESQIQSESVRHAFLRHTPFV